MLKGRNIQKARVLYDIITGVKGKIPLMRLDELNILARTIGNALFDMTPSWSGYKSEELIRQEEIDPKTKKVAEHYYPRQVAGWRIIEHVARYKGISRPQLERMIESFNRIHYTTAEENTRLVPFQKYGVFTTPEDSYRQAGIVLVKVKDVD